MKPTKSDLDFVADSKAAFLENRSPYASMLLLVIVGLAAAFTFWAGTSSVDEITKGQGKIVPGKFLQVVQNLEGGMLAKLNVSEGDVVLEKDPLLELDTTAFTANLNDSTTQRDSLLATISRLEAEASDRSKIEFPEQILEKRPDLVESETRLFDSKRVNLEESIQHLTKSLSLKTEELEMTRPLAEKGIVSQVELLRLESAMNDTEAELARIRSEYTKDALAQKSEAEVQLARIEQSIVAFKDKIRRASVLAPVSGIINKVHFNTIGGVIRSGEPIIEIVPLENELIVEAKVLPSDIAFIHPGQEATVKLTAYDFSIYGGLKGVVEHISADTMMDEQGDSYYTIRVRTGERTLKTGKEKFKVIPGMQAEVDILTGEKTILDYIFKPLMRAKMNALTER
ncbi:HlyD family type I secretion periplasmic adaptor subunit [Pelagicoccus albus]|uniref:HlyD family type I secretion periplasmic adaptor subunit n=1 Tax=Pelagicoccus albus TaxID=415222 RepID=A0A7X1E7H6_9BACT|nr:HlyD family type I secretion periplasmic adaptor subunit [Pelagicoccus albus]MBC2605148.1 HlyD family type I secretion periplasmic adaptor subunit [Pelagicoccus albus]